MKKILKIKHPPLERVIIKIHFSDELRLDVSKAGELARQIKPFYPQEPNIILLPLLKSGQTIEIPPMTNLRFLDEKGLNWVEIGKDFLIFVSKKYFSWSDLLEKILKIVFIFKEICGIKEILDLHITYVDKFKFSKEEFRLKEFFSLSFNKPEEWKILPHDYFVGIVPYDDEKRKIILRLKGKIEDNDLVYILETLSIGTFLDIPLEEPKIIDYLTETHDLIVDYFIEYLTEELRLKIGLEIE